MRRFNHVSRAILIVLLSSLASAGERWIDLTHPLDANAVFWPTAAPYHRTTDFEGITERGFYYSAYSFCTAEHGGTHLDAPVHFAEGKHAVDDIPLERLIGDGVVIDVTARVDENRDYQLTVADLTGWERAHGAIPANSIVLIRTGFSSHWPDAERYLGTDRRGAEGVEALSFPGLSEDAADWLVTKRRVKAVGIDTASIDFGKSRDFRTHVRLMRDNIPVFENVTRLEALPPKGSYIVALPAKLSDGSGAPLRIIARVTKATAAK